MKKPAPGIRSLTGVLIGLTAVMACFGVFVAMRKAPSEPAAPPPRQSAAEEGVPEFAGSESCRECHEKFYKLWAPSHHGKAMQPVTEQFVTEDLDPHEEPIEVGKRRFQADLEKRCVIEEGPEGTKSYPMVHALGGKNVFYFLTPLERGRLQVLPIAFHARNRMWFDTTGSMVRHFTDVEDEALDWTDPLLTFNTACHGCHVSQLSKNYDLATDTYRTEWREPGINCETCHGPGSEHNRVCREVPKGTKPKDLKIISTHDLTPKQRDDTCVPCHAKMRPLTDTFQPGERYFDHYDLTTYEDRDFYPDGRDLGENYTYTSWLASPCVKSGELECLHCHTASGRYRFAGDNPNNACLPCHKQRVENAREHTHHPAPPKGPKCISCHMPMTVFGHMQRSDHSMRPPTPAATIAFKSPNACNLCHADRPPEWADKTVRKWHKHDYQAPVLHRAGLIQAARKGDWARLPEMAEAISGTDRDAILATSLVRILQTCSVDAKWPVLRAAFGDASPLVRSAAVHSLAGDRSPETLRVLLKATADEYRVVRVAAGAVLAAVPETTLPDVPGATLQRALSEYEASQRCMPDSWSSHYNLGNFYNDRGDQRRALKEYQTALRLRPDVAMPMVNAAMLHARLGEAQKAEKLLKRAVEVDPNGAAIRFNLGLALAERRALREAEVHLRKALELDPRMAAAAYNLAVLVGRDRDRLDETVRLCRKAADLEPHNPKYAYTAAFYLHQTGQSVAATAVLTPWIGGNRATADIYFLAASILQQNGEIDGARAIYRQAAEDERLHPTARNRAMQAAAGLGAGQP